MTSAAAWVVMPPSRRGGDTRSRRIEAHREKVLALYKPRRDIMLDELHRKLGLAGLTVMISALHRSFAR